MENKFLTHYVKENLRQCQLKQLAILEHIDRICREHDIPYWLDGGTLLGAVRHGGFIPWDDDIDIAMRKADLKRFVQVAQPDLPENLFLQTPDTDPEVHSPIVKVRDLNSLYVEDADDFRADYQKGLFVDIFPMVECPDMPASWVKRLGKGISVSYDILHKPHFYSLRMFGEFFWFGAKYCLYRAIWQIIAWLRPHSPYYCNILINNGYGIRHRKDQTWPLTTIEFEGKPFSAPANPDSYLSDLYRNYMEIPPESKRKIHAVYVHPQLFHNTTSTP